MWRYEEFLTVAVAEMDTEKAHKRLVKEVKNTMGPFFGVLGPFRSIEELSLRYTISYSITLSS
jgi:hypothetical protein